MDTLGIEPRAFRMRSGCDTTTPCAPCRILLDKIIAEMLAQASAPAFSQLVLPWRGFDASSGGERAVRDGAPVGGEPSVCAGAAIDVKAVQHVYLTVGSSSLPGGNSCMWPWVLRRRKAPGRMRSGASMAAMGPVRFARDGASSGVFALGRACEHGHLGARRKVATRQRAVLAYVGRQMRRFKMPSHLWSSGYDVSLTR